MQKKEFPVLESTRNHEVPAILREGNCDPSHAGAVNEFWRWQEAKGKRPVC